MIIKINKEDLQLIYVLLRYNTAASFHHLITVSGPPFGYFIEMFKYQRIFLKLLNSIFNVKGGITFYFEEIPKLPVVFALLN